MHATMWALLAIGFAGGDQDVSETQFGKLNERLMTFRAVRVVRTEVDQSNRAT
jgi:hypothetical protein